MHPRPTIFRAFALVLVLRAARALPQAHSGWRRLLVGEVQSISSDVEALIWAIGCLWGIRVEKFIGRSRPGLNCVLLLTGLLFARNSLLKHVLANGPSGRGGVAVSDAAHVLFMLVVFLAALALVASATPGTAPRRVFCAVAFPFLGLLGLLSVAFGGEVIHALFFQEARSAAYTILLGPVFGCIVALVVALPSVLLYREIAAPTAALALIPAMAKRLDAGGLSPVPGAHSGLFDQSWPFLCALVIIAMFSHVCFVWVSRAPGERASRAA